MIYERQHIDIANYFNDRGLFLDLGGHFSRCEKPELTLMNAEAPYPDQVAKGMKALTETSVSHDILKLAKAIKNYDTLWEGLKSGFMAGIETRLEMKRDDSDLIRLALGLQVYPELDEIFQRALTNKGLHLEVKTFDAGWGGRSSMVSLRREDQSSDIYVTVYGTISRLDDLPAQDQDLRRLAENTFPRKAPA